MRLVKIARAEILGKVMFLNIKNCIFRDIQVINTIFWTWKGFQVQKNGINYSNTSKNAVFNDKKYNFFQNFLSRFAWAYVLFLHHIKFWNLWTLKTEIQLSNPPLELILRTGLLKWFLCWNDGHIWENLYENFYIPGFNWRGRKGINDWTINYWEVGLSGL